MGRFLKMLLIWLGIVLVLAFAIDYVVTAGLRKTDIRKYAVWNDIYASKANAELLVMGSSETWTGYSTYILDSMLGVNSYNIAIDGHGFKYQELRYETYRRFNDKPKTLIINLDIPGSLDANEGYAYEREQFFPFICDKRLIDQVAKDKQITLFDRYLPCFRYYGYREDVENGIASFFGKRTFNDGNLHKGYRGDQLEWAPASLSLDSIFSAPTKMADDLDKFVRERKAEGINVILVEFPEYYKLRGKFSNLGEVEGIFRGVAIRNDVHLLDYSYASICYDTLFYYNSSHLNKRGAEAFTELLCHDLDSLMHNSHTNIISLCQQQ